MPHVVRMQEVNLTVATNYRDAYICRVIPMFWHHCKIVLDCKFVSSFQIEWTYPRLTQPTALLNKELLSVSESTNRGNNERCESRPPPTTNQPRC